MATGTVTATQGGSTALGTAMAVYVLTGQNASPIGITASATNTTPSLATGTGVTTGSWVYGANLGLAGTYTVNGATTYKDNRTIGATGLEYISMRSTATMTGGVSATIGGTAGVNSISIVLLEILKGAGLAEDASSPGGFGSSGLSVSTTSFTPPAGSLLVAMVKTNGNVVVTVAMSDTLGGLTWTQQVKQNTSGNGYAGIWTAKVPALTTAGLLLAASI